MSATKPVDNCEENWHSCLWSLYLYGRVGGDMFAYWCAVVLDRVCRTKQDEESCTSKVNKWIEPLTIKKVPCLPLDTIDFTSSEKRMKLYEHGKSTTTGAVTTGTTSTTANTTTTATAVTANAISDSTKVQQVIDNCLTSPSLPILFSVLDEPYCNSFAKSADQLPVSLQSVYDPEHLQCTYLRLLEAGEQMAGLLEITPTQLKHLEQMTRGQSKSNNGYVLEMEE